MAMLCDKYDSVLVIYYMGVYCILYTVYCISGQIVMYICCMYTCQELIRRKTQSESVGHCVLSAVVSRWRLCCSHRANT